MEAQNVLKLKTKLFLRQCNRILLAPVDLPKARNDFIRTCMGGQQGKN